MIECIPLDEITAHKTHVDNLLKERIPIFEEVNKDEFEFIEHIIAFANDNFLFSHLIKENSQVSICFKKLYIK